MHIQFADKKDAEALKKIWNQCFEHDEEYCDFFFAEGGFSPERCVVAKNGSSIESAAYIFYGSIEGIRTIYLYAVSTAEKFRGKGNAGRILEHVFNHAEKNGVGYVVLKAADGRGGLYEKYGMKPAFSLKEKIYTSDPSADKLDFSVCDAERFYRLREEHLRKIPSALIWDRQAAEYMYKDIFTSGEIVVTSVEGREHYAVISRSGDKNIIRETDLPQKYILSAVNYAAKGNNAVTVRYPSKHEDGTEIYYGHLKIIGDRADICGGYMNLIAD
ncbi:MAG: GNAT family N-acetyltransferase [Huintestinicola sp.]